MQEKRKEGSTDIQESGLVQLNEQELAWVGGAGGGSHGTGNSDGLTPGGGQSGTG